MHRRDDLDMLVVIEKRAFGRIQKSGSGIGLTWAL